MRETTACGVVGLRPLTRKDAGAWNRLRSANHLWLQPWEASSPEPHGRPTGFTEYARALQQAARAGAAYGFGVWLDDALVGQLTVASVQYGSLRSASIGYWVSQHVAGRGVIPTAVALATDFCFSHLGLHRVEINIRPDNARSLRVVAKLGFRDEGLRRAYLHINGKWWDHRTFALCAEEVPQGLLARWASVRPGSGSPSVHPAIQPPQLSEPTN